MNKNGLFFLGVTGLLCACAQTPTSSISSSKEGTAQASTTATSSVSSEATPSSQSPSASTQPSSSSSSKQESRVSSSSLPSSSVLPEIDHIVVFCETHWTNVWAWDSQGNFFDSWPGPSLKTYDDDWKTFEFEGKTSMNIIFNEGSSGKKTADLSIPSKGYWWYYDSIWYQENPLAEEESSSSSEESYVPVPVEGLDNRHRTWYQLLVYSFADGNNDGIGDFKGLVNHLDYLVNLGITGIWLSPIHPSADYHGYDVKDYYAIDSKYEVDGVTFARVLDECHKRNIHVLMDMVLNHTSSQHPWCSQHPDWYSGEHIFSGSMPDLNYDKEEVRAEVKRIGKYWLDKGVDGFRLDGAAWIYGGGNSFKVESTTFKKTIDWWKEYGDYLKGVKNDIYLVGECWTDLTYIEQFYESGLNAFNFSAASWADDAMTNSSGASWVRQVANHQSRILAKNPDAVETSFLSNHDVGRYAAEFSGKKENIRLANALNVLSPGGSFIYYGDELGLTGTADGWVDQSYRTPMPFAFGATRGNAYMWKNSTSTTLSGNSADADAQDNDSLYKSLAKVISFKNQNPLLYYTKVSQISAGKNAVGVLRYDGVDEDYYLVLNPTTQEKTIQLDGEAELAFTLNSASLERGELTLGPKDLVVIRGGETLGFTV